MIGKHWVALGCAVSLIGVSGCGDKSGTSAPAKLAPKLTPATVEAGQEASLFPLAVGNQWVYDVESSVRTAQGTNSETSEVTFRVTKVEPVPGGQRATIEVLNKDKISERSIWRVNSKGIFQDTAGLPAVPFNPPQIVLAFPPKAGSTYKWSGTGRRNAGPIGFSSTTSKVLGPQEIDTAMGRMSAIAAESSSTWTANKVKYEMQGTIWWAPNVGFVRFTQVIAAPGGASAIVLRIKSHSIKGN